MRKVTVTLVQDTPSHAQVDLVVPENASDKEIIGLAIREAAENSGDHVFRQKWDPSNLRVQQITDGQREVIDGPIPID